MLQYKLTQNIYASNLKSRAVLVMNYLIFRSNKENTCFPSIKTIAKDVHISVNTVKRALDDLVDAGFVKKEARFVKEKNGAQTSNLYTLCEVEVEPEKNTDGLENIAAENITAKMVENVTVGYENFSTISNIDDTDEKLLPANEFEDENMPPDNIEDDTGCSVFTMSFPAKRQHKTIQNYWAAPQSNMIPP